MARFPRIDRPCPLSADEQRAIAGDCARCGRPVHSLDGLDDAARQALLSAARGPMCVSYRTPAVGLAAIALTLVAGAAMAGSPSASEGLTPAAAPASAVPVEPVVESPLELIWVGGVSEPQSAHWLDESDLPELPMIEPGTDTGHAAG